jgi:hypothetical protein
MANAVISKLATTDHQLLAMSCTDPASHAAPTQHSLIHAVLSISFLLLLAVSCSLPIPAGPFHVTSKHTGKIAETGLFEFAPIFFPAAGGTSVSEVRLPDNSSICNALQSMG